MHETSVLPKDHADASIMVMCVVIGKPPATLALVDTSAVATTSTTHTHSGLSFGAVGADRVLVACIAYNAAAAISSVTIGGVSATRVGPSGAASGWPTEMWRATVPTGTSGSVVLNISSAADNSAVALVRMEYLNSATPNATDSDNASPVATSVTANAGGFVLAAAAYGKTGSTTGPAWSNVTLLGSIAAGSGTQSVISVASKTITATGSTSPSFSVTLAAAEAGITAAFS